jgi:hypothetical protein
MGVGYAGPVLSEVEVSGRSQKSVLPNSYSIRKSEIC